MKSMPSYNNFLNVIRSSNILIMRLSTALTLIAAARAIPGYESLRMIQTLIVSNSIIGLFSGPIGEFLIFKYGIPSKKILYRLILCSIIIIPIGPYSIISHSILFSLLVILFQIDRHTTVAYLTYMIFLSTIVRICAILFLPIAYYGLTVTLVLSMGLFLILNKLKYVSDFVDVHIRPTNAIVFAISWYMLSQADLLFLSVFNSMSSNLFVSYLVTMKVLESSSAFIAMLSWSNVKLHKNIRANELHSLLVRRTKIMLLVMILIICLISNKSFFYMVSNQGSPLPLFMIILIAIGYLVNSYASTMQVVFIRQTYRGFGMAAISSIILVFVICALLKDELNIYGGPLVNTFGYVVFNLSVYCFFNFKNRKVI